MEEPVKKRGRKKTITVPEKTIETNEEPIRKKEEERKSGKQLLLKTIIIPREQML